MTTYLKHREEQSFSLLCDLVRTLEIEKPTIFDVGANKGQSVSKFQKHFPDSQIHSFEPHPSAFVELKKSYPPSANLNLHELALNNQTGSSTFNVTKVSEASSLLKPDPTLIRLSKDNKYDYETITIQCQTLDSFCDVHHISYIDILKIDVQGAELKVLQGASRFLQAGNVSIIYTEMNFAETYENQVKFEDLINYCKRLNYTLWDISPFLYTRRGRLWYANIILLQNEKVSIIEDRN